MLERRRIGLRDSEVASAKDMVKKKKKKGIAGVDGSRLEIFF